MITLEDGKYGRKAVLNMPWSDQLIDYFVQNKVVELELNMAKGWRGVNVAFLAKLTNLKSLDILDLVIHDVSSIHCLHGLKRLQVTTYCSTGIDFSAFPELEDCILEWRAGCDSLFECVTLKKLLISRYKGKTTIPFATLINLESLGILSGPIENLHGLSGLTKLRSLRLGDLRRLTSLTGIEGLANLEELEIDTCRRIQSIKEVGSLSRLKRLGLNNVHDIDSLAPLASLQNLQSLGFVESTNVLDGDLTPLLHLKSLTRLSFQNRRHYSHRREEFDAYTNAKPYTRLTIE